MHRQLKVINLKTNYLNANRYQVIAKYTPDINLLGHWPIISLY